MAYQHRNDLALTPEGDLLVRDGDLLPHSALLSPPESALVDTLRLRLLTPVGQWAEHPGMGSSLQELVGLPNIPSTAQEAERRLVGSLTFDGRFDPSEIAVTPLPVRTALWMHVAVTTKVVQRWLMVHLDLERALYEIRELE